MPKRLKHQKRGKGSPTFTATKKGPGKSSHIDLNDEQKKDVITGEIIELLNDPGRTAILAKTLFENGKIEYLIAAEGINLGQTIEVGTKAKISIGNVSFLKDLPEGCPIFNIELIPGDGGKLVKSSGLYALVMTKEKEKVFVKLPSGKIIPMKPGARATIGCISGGGRQEKPFIKAGKKFHAMKARSRPYPSVRGVAMNPVDHPFGGSQHHPGKSKSTPRSAPSGRKVGAIASKRTGTGRKKKNIKQVKQ